ncbi:hypothetical protein [Phormidium sp. FACHB-1136]|uniref:slr1659 superfamily regulator n=1 Tax=Phormidium sp. FACHB-1136 TaxID=2692848 RepID=UPI0018EFDB98|nr:hypothetical protein [Phormidium sp. FACHB-1136]
MVLRLSGAGEYDPIITILNQALDNAPDQLTLDLQKLEFLNSSGINMLSKFVIKVRQHNQMKLVVKGSKDIPWQGKSLKNLERLMPGLQLGIE